MIKLINIELQKIFKHKSIFVILFIIFIFCLFNNILYKTDYDNDGNYKYEDEVNISKYISNLKKELKEYDINKKSDKNMYITIKSKIDVAQEQKGYDKNSWQYIKYSDYLYNDIYNINYYTYIIKDNNNLKFFQNEYRRKNDYFKSDNWQYFVNFEKEELEKKIKRLNDDINTITDKKSEKELVNEIKRLSNQLTIINYRINNNISYDNTYLNRALEQYYISLEDIDKYDRKSSSYKEKIAYNEILYNLNINKYIIENNVNMMKQNNLNYQLRAIGDDYELFIVIIILIVSVILIGEEFNKGTIKLLLIKPYNRNEILFCKFIAGLFVILFTIIFTILCQLIIGGLLFGYGSLKIPIAIYNFNSDRIDAFNVFSYMFIRILAKLPMFVIILIINFILCIVINNMMAPFSITILLYTFSEVINNLIVSYNLKFMQYFITINWNFKDYLFGGISKFKYINLKKSILIYLIYVIILLGVMFTSFKKKNIKNV